MQFRLRTLLIVLAIVPPIIAVAWTYRDLLCILAVGLAAYCVVAAVLSFMVD